MALIQIHDTRWKGNQEAWKDYILREKLPNLSQYTEFVSKNDKCDSRPTRWAEVIHELVTSSFWIHSAIRLAAIICCGLGVSTFNWTIGKMEPVLIVTAPEDKISIGLLSTDMANSTSKYDFFVAEGTAKSNPHRQRFMLLAHEKGAAPDIYRVGLVAEESPFERSAGGEESNGTNDISVDRSDFV